MSSGEGNVATKVSVLYDNVGKSGGAPCDAWRPSIVACEPGAALTYTHGWVGLNLQGSMAWSLLEV